MYLKNQFLFLLGMLCTAASLFSNEYRSGKRTADVTALDTTIESPCKFICTEHPPTEHAVSIDSLSLLESLSDFVLVNIASFLGKETLSLRKASYPMNQRILKILPNVGVKILFNNKNFKQFSTLFNSEKHPIFYVLSKKITRLQKLLDNPCTFSTSSRLLFALSPIYLWSTSLKDFGYRENRCDISATLFNNIVKLQLEYSKQDQEKININYNRYFSCVDRPFPRLTDLTLPISDYLFLRNLLNQNDLTQTSGVALNASARVLADLKNLTLKVGFYDRYQQKKAGQQLVLDLKQFVSTKGSLKTEILTIHAQAETILDVLLPCIELIQLMPHLRILRLVGPHTHHFLPALVKSPIPYLRTFIFEPKRTESCESIEQFIDLHPHLTKMVLSHCFFESVPQQKQVLENGEFPLKITKILKKAQNNRSAKNRLRYVAIYTTLPLQHSKPLQHSNEEQFQEKYQELFKDFLNRKNSQLLTEIRVPKENLHYLKNAQQFEQNNPDKEKIYKPRGEILEPLETIKGIKIFSY